MFVLSRKAPKQVCVTVRNMLYIYGSKGNVCRLVRYKNIPVGVRHLCLPRNLKV